MVSCTVEKSSIPYDIIAKVGERIITKQDMIHRSEYTLRPLYCRESNYIHKKIILNSLIAEKLFSFEAEKNKIDLLDNIRFHTFITGRTEQTMRQMHYYEGFYKQVELDTSVFSSSYKLAGRTVDVTYLHLPDLNIAAQIKDLSEGGLPLDSAYAMIWDDSRSPKRQINWFDREGAELHRAIFNPNIKKGSIIGPLTTENNTHLLIQVNGWTDRPAVTDSEISLRVNDVRERLQENHAEQKYKNWVKDIMKGKHLELNPSVYPTYAERVMNIYLKSDSIKQAQLNLSLWVEPEYDLLLDSLKKIPKNNFTEDDILFHVDNVPWTIKVFHQKLSQHPLVFRKKKISHSQFQEQLKYAIADLIQNIEITKYCYSKGYDKSYTVTLNKELWYDAYTAHSYRNNLLEEQNMLNSDAESIAKTLNSIVDSLQNIYSDQIKIDTDLFESIELTNIDMTVFQHGVPFPKVVPPFPVYTSDNRLDYGQKRNFK